MKHGVATHGVDHVPRCVIQRGPLAVQIYNKAVDGGNNSRMAEMLAMRQAPGAETDTTFQSNFGTLDKQFPDDPGYVDRLAAAARRQGYEPSPNDIYVPTIAERTGDPRAFVRSASEARNYCEEKGQAMTLNGRTVAKHREPERDPFETAPKLAPQLARREAGEAMRADPKLKLGDAMEMVTAKHGSD